MSTMPGRRLERVTGSHIIPVTGPPSWLLKEMLLTSVTATIALADLTWRPFHNGVRR
jgi:hypothetical protein